MTTKHLSYNRRRGCLETSTVAKLDHMVPSRLMPFWAILLLICHQQLESPCPAFLAFPLSPWSTPRWSTCAPEGRVLGKNQIELTSFSFDNFQKRLFSVQITSYRIASVVFGAFEEYSRWESWWGAGLQLPSIKYVYIWTVNQRWQLSKQNENFGANIKALASYC